MQVEDADGVKDGPHPTVRVLDFQSAASGNRGIPAQTDQGSAEKVKPDPKPTTESISTGLPLVVETSILDRQGPVASHKKATPEEFVLTFEDDADSPQKEEHVVQDKSSRKEQYIAEPAEHPQRVQAYHKHAAGVHCNEVKSNKKLASNAPQSESSKNFKISSLQFQQARQSYTLDEGKPYNKMYKKIPGLVSFGLDFEHPLARDSQAIVDEEEASENSHALRQNATLGDSSLMHYQLSKIPETDRVSVNNRTGRSSQISAMLQTSQGPFLLRSAIKRLENFEEKIRRQPRLAPIIDKKAKGLKESYTPSLPVIDDAYQQVKKSQTFSSLQTLQEVPSRPPSEQKIPRTMSATKILQDIYQGKTEQSTNYMIRPVLSKHSLKFLSLREKRFLNTRESMKSNPIQKYEDCAYGQPVKGWGMTVGRPAVLKAPPTAKQVKSSNGWANRPGSLQQSARP